MRDYLDKYAFEWRAYGNTWFMGGAYLYAHVEPFGIFKSSVTDPNNGPDFKADSFIDADEAKLWCERMVKELYKKKGGNMLGDNYEKYCVRKEPIKPPITAVVYGATPGRLEVTKSGSDYKIKVTGCCGTATTFIHEDRIRDVISSLLALIDQEEAK